VNIFVFSGKPKSSILLLCVCCCFAISIPCTVWSQGYEDDPLFMEEEYGSFGMEFEDSEFGLPSDSMDPDMLGEGAYDPFGAPEDEEDLYVWIRRFESESDRERLYKAVYESDKWKEYFAPRIDDFLDRVFDSCKVPVRIRCNGEFDTWLGADASKGRYTPC